MYITLETDYAIRIMLSLAREKTRKNARWLSEQTGVTQRFTLKILYKLTEQGLVRSYKGAQGGYELARLASELNLCEVLEAMEGPYRFSRCLTDGTSCSCPDDGSCKANHIFRELSETVRDRLSEVTLQSLL